MDEMKIMVSQAEYDEMMEHSKREPVVFYKHSASCPVSARAQEQVALVKHDLPVYTLTVQYARELSNKAAEELGVTHQTPQAIIIKDGKPTSDFSHGSIKSEKLTEAVSEAT